MRFSSVTMARQAMRLCAAASLVALVATAGNAAAAEEVTQITLAPPSLPNPASELPTLWLRMPPDEKVAFSGQINYDSPAGKNHSMLYPAPSFVGFLAAVATHGAISSAQRSREQDAMRTQADKVLVKYQPLLDEYTVAELATTSLAMMVKPGKKLSLQKHHHRAEHWVVVSGTAEVTIDGKVTMVSENQSIYLPLGCTHRLANPGKILLEVIEVQTGSYLGEDDIIRIEDEFGRA